jgi:hypothetical protein
MDTQVKIICDNCHQEISPTQNKRKLRKGFFEVGVVCPLCGFWVHSYYSNDELELAQKILANFKKLSTRSPQHRQRYERKIVEFMRQHQKIQERFGVNSGPS